MKKEKILTNEEILNLQLADSAITNLSLAVNEKNAKLDVLKIKREYVLLQLEKEEFNLKNDIKNLQSQMTSNIQSKQDYLEKLAKKYDVKKINSYNHETGEINVKE